MLVAGGLATNIVRSFGAPQSDASVALTMREPRCPEGGGLLDGSRSIGDSSKLPHHRPSSVGHIGAVGAGPNRAIEMLAERGMVLADARQGLADSPGDCASGTFGRGPGAPITPPESDCTGELPDETFAFRIRLRGPFNVTDRPRFLDVFVDLGEPAAIRLFRALIEQLASISRITNQAGSNGAAGRVGPSLSRGDEIEDVELSPRIGEKARQIVQALRIAHTRRSPLEPDRPIVALAMEDRGVGGMGSR